MKKLLAVALILCLLFCSGCSNVFSIRSSKFIFTERNLDSHTAEEMRSALTSWYGIEPEAGNNKYTWEKGDHSFFGKSTQSATLTYAGEKITSIIYKIANNEPYTDSKDPYIKAIDEALSWFENIDKDLNVNGTVYRGTSKWDDPYLNYSFYGKANDSYKLIMQLEIISGYSVLQWKYENKYIKYTFESSSYSIEAGIAFQ